MQRKAFVALWCALFVQLCWIAGNAVLWHRTPGVDAIGIAVTAYFTGFAVVRARWRALLFGARILVAIEFLGAVADRFGLLGPPGSGTYWGDWAHFVSYTASVAAYLPASFAPTLAVLATVAEVVVGAALLSGLRPAPLGAAALLFVYTASMAVSLPPAELFHYTVPVLCTGMLATFAAGRASARRTRTAAGEGRLPAPVNP